MRLLFICNQGQNRSKTAELLFKNSFETRSKGLFNNLVTEKDLDWADIIIVMEDFQREELGKRFPNEYLKKRIISLNIPDIYRVNQPELAKVLREKIDELLLPIELVRRSSF